MKFLCLLILTFVFVGCDSKSDNKPLAVNNPSSLRATGQATALELAMFEAVKPNAAAINPAASCPSEVSGFLGSVQAECGALAVPEDHRAQTSKNLAVGYIKIPKVFDPAKPLLVLEQGGPGASSMMLAAMYITVNSDLARKFNILAIEQRGTAWTYPVALCETVIDVEAQLLAQSIDPVAGSNAVLAANEKCLQETASNMDVSKISTYQIAKDIVFGAEQMGFDVFNFYGVSYGTVVGQYLLKYSEQNLNNVVLDSPAVVGKLWMNDAIKNLDGLAEAKFEVYRQAKFPNLSIDEMILNFQNAGEVFARSPLTVPVTFGDKKVDVVVDGDLFMGLLFQMLVVYSQDQIVQMLLNASNTAVNNPEQAKMIFGFLLPQLQLIGQSSTTIMYQSIICREFSFANLDPSDAVKDWTFMPRVFGDDVSEQYAGGLNVCYLPIPKADEDVILTSPVATNKNVLVVGGEFDHVTNPAYVAEVTVNMPNAHTTVFKGAAHGVFVSQPCITQSITNYLLSSNGDYTNACTK